MTPEIRSLTMPRRKRVSCATMLFSVAVAFPRTNRALGMYMRRKGAMMERTRYVIFLALALYRLFKGVDQNLAVLMVILGGVLPSAIDFFNVLNDAAAMMLARGADFLSVFDQPQRNALAMLFLRLHDHENFAAEIFWGLWLIPLAILVYRSGFLPRFLGIWLTINGFAYVALSFTGWLLPQYYAVAFNSAFPVLFGELAFMLWLVIKGAKPKPSVVPASSAAGG